MNLDPSIRKIPTAGMSREEWLAARRTGIGGSDAGAVLGMNPYRTPYAVWADKTGRLPSLPETEAMRLGRDLEDYVARRFQEASGKRARKVNAILQNPAYPFALANIDREIAGEQAGLELKTASALRAKAFRGGEFPDAYYAQCVHYMAVTGAQRWYLAALILGEGLKIFRLSRRENAPLPEWCESGVFVPREELDALLAAEEAFWRLVESDTPPAFTGLPGDSLALALAYPGEAEAPEALLPGLEEEAAQALALKEQIALFEAQLERCTQELKGRMENAPEARAGRYEILWKPQARRTFDVKAFAKAHPGIDLSPYYRETAYRKFEIRKEES